MGGIHGPIEAHVNTTDQEDWLTVTEREDKNSQFLKNGSKK